MFENLAQTLVAVDASLCLLFIHPPAHGSEVSPAARNTLDSARIPRTSKLLICGLFQKGRVLAQDGVKQVREPNPLCLGDQPEEGPIAVEAPGATGLYQLQARLVVSGEKLAANPAIQCLISQFERVRSIPLGADNRDGAVRQMPLTVVVGWSSSSFTRR